MLPPAPSRSRPGASRSERTLRAGARPRLARQPDRSRRGLGRARLDLADVQRLLDCADVDLDRTRDYFRMFDREPELDRLLRDVRR